MSKKENTTGTTMATEIIRDMKRRETEAIGELSGILMDLDKVLYTLEVVQENSDIVGKSVNDGALFMMNRNRIYQNSSIAHDYVRGFEQKLAKTIDTLDTDDITEEEPAGDSNTDSAGETHTQEMESKKKYNENYYRCWNGRRYTEDENIYQRHSINAGYDQIHRSAKTLLGI